MNYMYKKERSFLNMKINLSVLESIDKGMLLKTIAAKFGVTSNCKNMI